MGFFSSGIGQYLWQTVLYSFVVALIVEAIMRRSFIRDPSAHIKMRLLSIWMPALYPALLFFVSPNRAGAGFHQAALFDSTQWLSLHLFGGVYGWHIAVVIVAVTIYYFMVKERAERMLSEQKPDVFRLGNRLLATTTLLLTALLFFVV